MGEVKPFTNFIDLVVKLATTITLIILVLGYADLNFYYSNFGIKIGDYMDTSELILLSIGKLALVAVALFFHLLVWMSISKNFTKIDPSFKNNAEKDEDFLGDNPFVKLFLENKTLMTYLLILFICTVIIIIGYLNYPTNQTWFFLKTFIFIMFWTAGLLFMFGLQFLWYISQTTSNDSDRYNRAQLITTFIIFFVAFIAASWIENKNIYTHIRKYGLETKIELFVDNKKIIASDSIVLIGQTNAYYFLWHRKSRQTQIFQRSSITSILINN